MNQEDKYTSEFKAEVVLKVIKGNKTQKEIAREYGINASLIGTWKKIFLKKSYRAFETACHASYRDYESDIKDENHTRIRELRIRNGFSIKQIGEMLGIKEYLYTRYENEPQSMPSECLIGLTQIYHVSADYILGIQDDIVDSKSESSH